ncbi:MAG: nucleoside monophosphate kinase [Bradymonadales bacterium]|nr:nucleoside monophosphate kinase [Bradymonadales bacterium]
MAAGTVQNIVVAGKSGAGKQPRIDVLTAEFGLTQLSTGNIFREYLGAYKKLGYPGTPSDFHRDGHFLPDAQITDALDPFAKAAALPTASAVLGLKAAFFVDQGLFVPDGITNELFASSFRSAKGRGLVLDGYPRTSDQSRFLLDLAHQMGTKLDLILMVDNDDEAIVQRTIGRRICPNKSCGKVYHLEYKPPREGRFCLACGSEVIWRSDDTEEKIQKRLQEFHEKAAPAIQLLQDAGIPLASVPGNLPVFTEQAVRNSVLEAIQALI